MPRSEPVSPTLAKLPPRVKVKRMRRKEARPGELLDAALTLFVEKGFAATRVEEVARRAEVSKGTLFLYFSSKEELFKAVVRDSISGHFPVWNAEFEAFTGPTAEMLRQFMVLWWARMGATKASGITKLMMSESSNFPELAAFYHQEVMAPGQALIWRILQRGVDRGEFRAMDIQYGVYTVLAPMIFLLTRKHAMGCFTSTLDDLLPELYIAAQVDALLHGLCCPPTSTPPSLKKAKST